jgi:hypothetical protein
MSWLVSNWVFILFVGGMAWMHLRHGGHGDHGNRHQRSTPARRQSAGGADPTSRAVVAKSPVTTGARSDGHAGHDSTAPKQS